MTSAAYAVPNINPKDVLNGLKGFHGLRVLVVGDLFLDEYIESEMYEISKEGPIPVVRFESKTQLAGAAGNLASSIRNLGGQVSVVGLVGNDANGRILTSQLRRKGIRTKEVISCTKQPTLTYTKFRARVENTPSKEILRMDVLPIAPLSAQMERRVIAAVRREAKNVDAIIVLDQIEHLISDRLLKELPAIAKKSSALLHGSSRDRIGAFSEFDLLTPNDREACSAVGLPVEEVVKAGQTLKRRGRHKQIMLTLGAQGMELFPHRGTAERIPSVATDVQDVTGAGDAVSSVTVLGNVLGWDLKTLAWTASLAASIAIAHVGTHHVTLAELRARIRSEILSLSSTPTVTKRRNS